MSNLIDFCLALHDRFDESVWRGPSFHNATHVRLNILAAEKLIEAADDAPDGASLQDRLELRESMRSMQGKNDQFSNAKLQTNYKLQIQYSFDELLEAVRLMFAMHDLGNILKKSTQSTRQSGGQARGMQGQFIDDQKVDVLLREVGLEFLDCYRAKGAEERSKEIAKLLMNRFEVEAQLQELVVYLMGQTSFMLPQPVPPFGRFVRLCDQLSASFLGKDNVAYRLMREWQVEDPAREVSIERQVNFVHWRLGELLPDEIDREWLLRVWGKPMPPKIENLPEEKMSAVKAVKWLEVNRPELC